jgi:hypothetical protein
MDPAYEKGKSGIDLTSTALVILGVIYGVWNAQRVFGYRSSTGHLGSICCDKKRMGYFVANIPSKWRQYLFPFFICRTPTPRILSIKGMIKAGDEGVFTSSMFNWILGNYEAVSWKPLYEAFFQEVEWNSRRNELLSAPKIDRNKDLERYMTQVKTYGVNVDKVEADKNLDNDASCCEKIAYFFQKLFSYMLSFFKNLSTLSLQKIGTCFRSIFMFILSLSFQKIFAWVGSLFKSGQINIDGFTFNFQTIGLIDRHVLYKRWRFLAPKPSPETLKLERNEEEGKVNSENEFHQPLLVKSVKDLKKPDHSLHLDKRTQILKKPWNMELQRLWIREQKPCIEVSAEDIAALSFILGIKLHCKDYLPGGIGAFGIALSSEKVDCITMLRLVYHRRNPFRKAMGSGYSTLFAKHLACGCLPFAQYHDKLETQTIPIDEEVLLQIKSGKSIADRKNPGSRWTEAMNYLHRLPSSTSNNFYSGIWPEDDFGQIYGFSPQKGGDGQDKKRLVGSWWEAVTGIAFGGLVPMATKPLIEAVRFTIEGGSTGENGFAGLETLIYRVDLDTQKRFGDLERLAYGVDSDARKKLQIFGKQDYLLMELMERNERLVNFDVDDTDRTTREVVWRLGRYTTLLERLMAYIDYNCTATQLRDDVFECCSKKIKKYYEGAVARHLQTRGISEAGKGESELEHRDSTNDTEIDMSYGHTLFVSTSEEANIIADVEEVCYRRPCPPLQGTHPPTPIEGPSLTLTSVNNDDLEDIINKFDKDHPQPITVADCAKVARCILVSWTYLVHVVDWDTAAGAEHDRERGADNSKYRPVPLHDVPNVSAWE